MCGIAGFLGPPDLPVLERMVGTMLHRGPDSIGLWSGPSASLGMRRLSIIDLETGDQPVFNEDETIAVVFNGEIFNFVELREELLQAGHRFRTHHSDTEVIVHLYEEYGLDFPNRLNGMFAIALWDARVGRLVLVRDRTGIKPLYYAPLGTGITFGSEPKALLAHPKVSRDPDFIALHHYFSLKNIPAPHSAYAAIRQLPPGTMLVCTGDGRREEKRWWRIRFAERSDIAEDEAAHTIRALLEDAVRLNMRSDVPFGAYLSGGIDSSSVVALMSGLSERPVHTFTLVYEDGFPQKDADRAFARAVSARYGTEHHERMIRFDELPDRIDRIVTAFDEPFSGVISTFFLTELISGHVKVALSGDGADELFGSYKPHRLAQPLAALAAGMELSELDPLPLPQAQLAALLERGDEAAIRMAQYLCDDVGKSAFYTERMHDAVGTARTETLVRALYEASATGDPLNRALAVDFATLLPDQVLAFVDRLSMAHSVEVRPPFLDHRLVEYAATLSGRLKIANGRVKHILKEAVRDLLPADLLDRPKEGFLMPINAWMLAHMDGFVRATLAPDRLARHGLLRDDAVQALIEDHYAGRARSGDRIWNLVMFQLWWDTYQERGQQGGWAC